MSFADVVAEVAEELRELGHDAPFSAGDLYVFYDDMIDQHGLDEAEADARRRYLAHVNGTRISDIPPLVYPCRST